MLEKSSMKKQVKLVIMLATWLAMGVITTLSYADDDWKTYTDKNLNFSLHYPANGMITGTGLSVRKNFYLDPLQPIADLVQQAGFENTIIDPHSLVEITFPDYSLILMALNKAPQNTPPPNALPVTAGKYKFYQQHTWDAGMCHHDNYYTYYLPHDAQYLVFIFIISTSCASDVNTPDTSYRLNMNPEDFEKILSTIELNATPPAENFGTAKKP
jgi:hypothetical protein